MIGAIKPRIKHLKASHTAAKLILEIGRVWKLSMLMDFSTYIKLSKIKTNTSKRISHHSPTHCCIVLLNNDLHFEKQKSADYNRGLLADLSKAYELSRHFIFTAFTSNVRTSELLETLPRKKKFTLKIEFDESSTGRNFLASKMRLIHPKKKIIYA